MDRTISREELQAKIDRKEGVILLEALPESYYRKGHLPGAHHLPHDRVRELASQVVPDKHAAIVTYCASATCQNSHIAAETLRAMGYANVTVYVGGKQDWTDAGLPLQVQETQPA
jgi:rhodanese-related sulfurtransferase